MIRCLVVLLLGSMLPARALASCPDDVYTVTGPPLLSSPGGAFTSDAITIANGTVAIASGCPAGAARIRESARGTRLRAVWPSCGSVQRVRLRATIDALCGTLHGVLTTRRPRTIRRFDATTATPAICGGIVGIGCAEGQFCDLPSGQCQAADLQGVCVPIPTACLEVYTPVCGCDGTTYPNDCHRRTAATQLAYDGPCATECTTACDCEKTQTLPSWCGALACPACECRWQCEQHACTVYIGAITDPPVCTP